MHYSFYFKGPEAKLLAIVSYMKKLKLEQFLLFHMIDSLFSGVKLLKL